MCIKDRLNLEDFTIGDEVIYCPDCNWQSPLVGMRYSCPDCSGSYLMIMTIDEECYD